MENLTTALYKNNLLKNSNIKISKIGWEFGSIKMIKLGDIIYSEGDASKAVYLLLKGRISLMVRDCKGKSSSVIFSNNDFFGAKELFSKINRCSEAVALIDSFLVELTLPEIERLVRIDDNVAYNIQKGNFDFKYGPRIKKMLREKYFNGSDPENIKLN